MRHNEEKNLSHVAVVLAAMLSHVAVVLATMLPHVAVVLATMLKRRPGKLCPEQPRQDQPSANSEHDP